MSFPIKISRTLSQIIKRLHCGLSLTSFFQTCTSNGNHSQTQFPFNSFQLLYSASGAKSQSHWYILWGLWAHVSLSHIWYLEGILAELPPSSPESWFYVISKEVYPQAVHHMRFTTVFQVLPGWFLGSGLWVTRTILDKDRHEIPQAMSGHSSWQACHRKSNTGRFLNPKDHKMWAKI